MRINWLINFIDSTVLGFLVALVLSSTIYEVLRIRNKGESGDLTKTSDDRSYQLLDRDATRSTVRFLILLQRR